jgi:hypothetical protein
MFVAVAVLGVAVSASLTSDPSQSMAVNTPATVTSVNHVAADYYHNSVANAVQNVQETSASSYKQAAASDGQYSSVPALKSHLQGANATKLDSLNYFAFSRWATVTLLPVPAVGFANIGSLVVAAFVSLANLLFTIGAIVLLGVGLLMLLITSINLLTAFLPTIDWFFAQLGGQWLTNPSGGGGTGTIASSFQGASPFFIAIFLMVIAVAIRLSPLANKDRSLLGDIVISAVAIAALMTISTASTKDWNNSNSNKVDAINGNTGSSIPLGSNVAASLSVDGGDPSNYQKASFGWFLANGSDIVDGAVNFAGGLITSITSGLGAISNSGTTTAPAGSSCYNYLNTGMHGIASDVLENKKGIAFIGKTSTQSILSFDSLVYTVLYRPAAEASYGANASGDATWCRMWESARGSDPVDQAYIARTANMYSDALSNNTDAKDGGDGILKVDGGWADSDGGNNAVNGHAKLAGFFGNTLSTSKGTTAFKFYWAACSFEGNGRVKVSSAFTNALGTAKKDDDSPDGSKGDKLSDGDCQTVLQTADSSSGYIFGAKNKDNDSMKNLSPFAWTQDDKLFTLFFIGFSVPADTSTELANADMNGSEAINFFKMVYGSSAGNVWPAAIVAVVGTIMMSIGLLPMQVGALILQMISVLSLIAFPIVLLVMIVPIRAGRKAFFTILKLFISSKLVQLIFVTFIAIAIAIINLLTIAFGTVLNVSLIGGNAFTGDGTPLGTFIKAILNAVAIGIAFYGTKKLLRDVFKADVTTIKGAMSVGQNMASTAVNGGGLREMGLGQLKSPVRGGAAGTGGFGNANLPEGLGKNTGADNEPRQPEMPKRQDEKQAPEDPKQKPNETAEGAAGLAGGIAGVAGGASGGAGGSALGDVAGGAVAGGFAGGAPGALAGGSIEVPAAASKSIQGTVGDGMKNAPTEGPNSRNPEAPVPNDQMLTEEQRKEAAEKTEGIRSVSGIKSEDVSNEIGNRSRNTAALESQLDDGELNGDEEQVRDAVNKLGGSSHLEGSAEEAKDSPAIEASRRDYFDNNVDNEERPVDRGEKAGEGNVHAATLERIARATEEQNERDDNTVTPEGSVQVVPGEEDGQNARDQEVQGNNIPGLESTDDGRGNSQRGGQQNNQQTIIAGAESVQPTDTNANNIGQVDNNAARADNYKAAIGSEFEAPGMAEDSSTANSGSAGLGSEGLNRRLDSLPGEISRSMQNVMEPAFDRFDALGRTVRESAEVQEDALQRNTESNERISEAQIASMENLQQTIANWFPDRGSDNSPNNSAGPTWR